MNCQASRETDRDLPAQERPDTEGEREAGEERDSEPSSVLDHQRRARLRFHARQCDRCDTSDRRSREYIRGQKETPPGKRTPRARSGIGR